MRSIARQETTHRFDRKVDDYNQSRTLQPLCVSVHWLETPRCKRARHQPAQAKFVKRRYRGQVALPELVVNHTESRHYYAWPVVVHLHDREPKIHVLVVPACDEFVRAEKKDRPRSDLFADDVAVSLFHFHYFQGSGNLQT